MPRLPGHAECCSWTSRNARLLQEWSPQQIGNTLRSHFPDRPEMRVLHETIYQGLYRKGAVHRCCLPFVVVPGDRYEEAASHDDGPRN